jgi:NADH-quinone oxidoreductase subunit E
MSDVKPPNLAEDYASEVQAILAKYPSTQKRSAVMPLLYLAQREGGYVTKQAMQEIADILEITPTEVAGIVGFYSLYYDHPAGKYRIQVCNDLSCALRGADEFLQKLCDNLGIKVGGTTPDGLVTIEAVMCLAGCDKAPLFQVQASGEATEGEVITYHENQTVEGTLAQIDSWRKQAETQKGA